MESMTLAIDPRREPLIASRVDNVTVSRWKDTEAICRDSPWIADGTGSRVKAITLVLLDSRYLEEAKNDRDWLNTQDTNSHFSASFSELGSPRWKFNPLSHERENTSTGS